MTSWLEWFLTITLAASVGALSGAVAALWSTWPDREHLRAITEALTDAERAGSGRRRAGDPSPPAPQPALARTGFATWTVLPDPHNHGGPT